MNKSDIYYEAMKARDPRFDGKFFVGVKTTGIYCRPICPAKPKKENVEFFHSHLEAEKAGYRPCLRCRPESAHQSPAWVGTSAVVQRAVKILNSQDSIDFNEDEFAALFGVSARHLRRLFVEEIGKTPKQLSFENRLNLARKLIVETSLPITEVAFAAGFDSIRRFNDSFKERFKKAPREVRRQKSTPGEALCITLPYRPPFDFTGLMNSYQNHRMGALEWFSDNKMLRVISFGGQVGTVRISDDPAKSSLLLEINYPDTAMIHAIISRVRNQFDLDSDPVIVANCLETEKDLKKMLKAHPGIRLPSGWDPFEVAISAILGQLVSVERGRALVAELIELAGKDSGLVLNETRVKLFPTAEDILACDLQSLKTTGARKQTLLEFSKALVEKRISLQPTQDVEQFLKDIQSIRGIGPWTAQYMALKVLRHTDTFPATDLILARALEKHRHLKLEQFSPWKGYVAALFWRNYTHILTKRNSAKKKGRSRGKSPT